MPRLVWLALLACCLVPVSLAGTGSSVDYVVGTYRSPTPLNPQGVFCTTAALPVVAGGACDLTPSDLSSFTITVKDARGQPVAFYWTGETSSLQPCDGGGSGTGSVALSLPAPCAKVWVTPDFNSVAGTIAVS